MGDDKEETNDIKEDKYTVKVGEVEDKHSVVKIRKLSVKKHSDKEIWTTYYGINKQM